VEAYDGPQIVGMDLHRRRSVLARMTEDGRKLATARITNGAERLAAEIRRAGLHPQVVLAACYGWYWAADALAAADAEVHLAHPLGVKAFSHPPGQERPVDRTAGRFRSSEAQLPLRPIIAQSGRSRSPGHSGHVVSLITAETGHTGLNHVPSFSSVPIFDVSRCGP
jgi:hypothetical protein